MNAPHLKQRVMRFAASVVSVLLLLQTVFMQNLMVSHAAPVWGDSTITPVLWYSSETATPGATINLEGGHFSRQATAWIVAIDSSGNQDSATKAQMVIRNQSDFLIQAIVPAGIAAGLWAVWVQNGNLASAVSYVNRARLFSATANTAYPGLSFKVFGKNLIQAGGDYTTSSIKFVNGSTSLTGTITAGSATQLTVTAPAVANGVTYDIYVSNGKGGTLGDNKADSTLTGRNGGTDSFSLGTAWGPDYTYAANVYNTSNDGRLGQHTAGDGSTNDLPAIQAAINTASGAGGGVVYLPAATYYLDNSSVSLKLESNVVLKGDGPTQTLLDYGEAGSTSTQGLFLDGSTSTSGLLNLSFHNLNSTSSHNVALANQSGGSVSKFFMKNVTFDLGTSTGSFNLTDGSDILITGSTIDASTAVDDYSVVLTNLTRFQLLGTTITYAIGRIRIPDAVDSYLSGNTFNRIGDYNNPWQQESGGIEINDALRLVVDNNTVEVTGNLPTDSVNDGESILTQASVYPVAFFGSPTAATATTVTDTTQAWTGSSFSPYDDYTGAAKRPIIIITDGEGRGQWRYITSHTATQVTTDRAWDITPNTDSKYLITYWLSDRTMITGNTIQNGKMGIMLYSGGTDTVLANNTLTNTGAIYLSATDEYLDPSVPDQWFQAPMWNVIVTGNTVSNTSGLRPASIVLTVQNWDTVGYWSKHLRSLTAMGVELRSNTVNGHSPPQNTGGYFVSQGEHVYVLTNLGGGSPNVPDGEALIGNIVEDTTTTNIATPYQYGFGISQLTVDYSGQSDTNLCVKLSSLDGRSDKAVPDTTVRFYSGTDLAARTDYVGSVADGTVQFTDMSAASLLSNGPSYTAWIKPPGYLARTVSGLTNVKGTCTTVASDQPFLLGDFTGTEKNSITNDDISAIITAYTAPSDVASHKVTDVLGHAPTLSDIVTVIRNFNTSNQGAAVP